MGWEHFFWRFGRVDSSFKNAITAGTLFLVSGHPLIYRPKSFQRDFSVGITLCQVLLFKFPCVFFLLLSSNISD